MTLQKETDKHLQMTKKENPFKKATENDIQSPNTITKSKTGRTGSSAFSDNAKSSLSNGFRSYRDELESDDQGIEATGKIADHAYKTTKITGRQLKAIYHKQNDIEKAEDKQLQSAFEKLGQQPSKISKGQDNVFRRAEDEHFNSVKNKLGNEQKNRQRKSQSKISQTEQGSFTDKILNKPKQLAQKTVSKGVSDYKETLTSDDDGIKVGVEGTKLVKEGAKTLSQVKNVQRKFGANSKLQMMNSKLRTEGVLQKPLLPAKKGQKALLKKKQMLNAIQQKQGTKSVVSFLTHKTGTAATTAINSLKRLTSVLAQRLMATKVAAWVGAISLKLLPVIAVVGLLLGIIIITMAIGGGGSEEVSPSGAVVGLDPEVEKWRDLVSEIAEKKGMGDYVSLILAIIQVETAGKAKDIMQSSESAGHPSNYFQDERQSIEQGVSHLKNVIDTLKGFNSKYLEDTKLIAQSYNFGLGFARYVGSNKYDGYSLGVSEKYSRDVVAVALGNSIGETYPYVNTISQSVGKTYLYRNGGNFLYGELIGQYIVNYGDGEFFPPVQPMKINSPFGYRPPEATDGIGSTGHKGMDLDCVGNVTPINAMLGGVVVSSGRAGGLGNTVVLKHEENLYTTYGHMSSLSVSQGQAVSAGQKLGVCGNTGNSTGPHLHLEMSPVPHKQQYDPYPHIKHLFGG